MSLRIPCIVLIIFLCWNCAQQGSPTGGPRDEDPPVVLECIPPNYSKRFDANKIMITFDEYIVLDNVNQELIVSPPMEEEPEVKLRKKTIIIQFEEALRENTTYTFNFGSAIKDLHEGNKLLNYEYVFSTGDVLDSLSVKGTLKYAHDLTEPDEPISIMLYDDLRDSVPLIDIPLYIGKSDDSGVFSVNNLKPGVYKLFALKDGNSNFLFDLPTEEIAFLDTTLNISAEFIRSLLDAKEVADTLETVDDGVKTPDDTTTLEMEGLVPEGDSLVMEGPDLNSIYVDLMLFTEESKIQYLTDYSRDDPRQIILSFARPLSDTFHYEFFDPPDEEVERLEYFSLDRDSLILWILDSLEYKRDTLAMKTEFTVKDTANRNVLNTDTLFFTFRRTAPGRKRGEQEEEKVVEKLQVSTIRTNMELDLNRHVEFEANLPVKGLHDSLIWLYQIPDSVEVEIPFRVSSDTIFGTRGWLAALWDPASIYRMFLLPGAVQSWYALEHDTIDVTFRTRDNEYYGQILLTVENVTDRILVQLINKGDVIREQTVTTSGLIRFPYLPPESYRIKFIHDRNGNGKWDTGKYMDGQQPEPVEFLPGEITVRSNWDHDVTMVLEKGVPNPHSTGSR